jgi:hypothetical protein
LTFASEKDGDRRRKSDPVSDVDTSMQKSRSAKGTNGNPEVGSALRSVYQRTIDEDIPPEMLDLLGKLG